MINLTELRMKLDMTVGELAQKVGVTPSYISQIEKNDAIPGLQIIYNLADALGISRKILSDYFIDKKIKQQRNRMSVKYKIRDELEGGVKNIISEGTGDANIKTYIETTSMLIPVLGSVPGGNLIDIEAARENSHEFITLPKELFGGYDGIFALRVTCDSMKPRVEDGDIIIVDPEQLPEKNDMAIVLVNGEVLLCSLEITDKIIIHKQNPEYATMVLDESENIKILGRVIKRIVNNP